jgi:hypothetical protein
VKIVAEAKELHLARNDEVLALHRDDPVQMAQMAQMDFVFPTFPTFWLAFKGPTGTVQILRSKNVQNLRTPPDSTGLHPHVPILLTPRWLLYMDKKEMIMR